MAFLQDTRHSHEEHNLNPYRYKMYYLVDSSLNHYRHSDIFQANSGLKQPFRRSLMIFLVYYRKKINPKVVLLHLANQVWCRAAVSA